MAKSKDELTIVDGDGFVYVISHDEQGEVEWGVTLSPDTADRLAAVLKQKAQRARATIIEGAHFIN